MSKGSHLIVDCRDVPRSVCTDHKKMMTAIQKVLTDNGCVVLNEFGKKLGAESPPGYAITFTLDESHFTAHSYSDEQKIAMDIFTCGNVKPTALLKALRKQLNIGTIETREIDRF